MLLIVHQLSFFIITSFSNTSTWPLFQYVSMETSLDQQYENSYYISCRKYSQNWRYCHLADIYIRWLFLGFFWDKVPLEDSSLQWYLVHYSYGCIKPNEKAAVNNRCRRQFNCNLLEGTVTCFDKGM